jgi:hypothetical protein
MTRELKRVVTVPAQEPNALARVRGKNRYVYVLPAIARTGFP